jgi:uncharacterized membrane protein
MRSGDIIILIVVLGITSYAMRAGGYVLAGSIRDDGNFARLLRLAPGNLFVAFVSAGCLGGGRPMLLGGGVALATMVITTREWAAVGAGFLAAMIASSGGI